jgi:hypothetical protein
MPPHKESAVMVNLIYIGGVEGLSEEISLKEVDRIRDPRSLTGMEKKHLPLIVRK